MAWTYVCYSSNFHYKLKESEKTKHSFELSGSKIIKDNLVRCA